MQVPGRENVRSVVDPTQLGGEGLVHVLGVPEQTPWLQVSLSVQASPSLQDTPLAKA